VSWLCLPSRCADHKGAREVLVIQVTDEVATTGLKDLKGMKDAIRKAFPDTPTRRVTPVFVTSGQVSADVLADQSTGCFVVDGNTQELFASPFGALTGEPSF
jgi:hypothetical protein